MPRDAAVELLLGPHTDAVVATAEHLRDLVLDAQPQLIEAARPGWHSINYRDPAAGHVCAIFPRADDVQLVFEQGALLPDPSGRLSGGGRQVRSLVFPAGTEIDDGVVREFLDLAVDLGVARRRR